MTERITVVAAVLILVVTFVSGCGGDRGPQGEVMDRPGVNELIVTDTKVGSGEEAVAGRDVVVHYTGWLYDPSRPQNRGRQFDSSVDRGEPFTFSLGAGQVIRGWDEGVAGMRVGGSRTLVIPPDMAYGARGAGGVIPPDATLVFDVELLDVRR